MNKPAAAPVGNAVDAPRSFPIVAIGASAGGLGAIERFLAHVPAGSGMAFVIIQHLDPRHRGGMPKLLQRVTPMPVVQARNRMKVKPDGVYVIPPKRDLSILHDCLFLLEPGPSRGLRLPIDYFFRALADDRRENAVGVVLSGMGSDGTQGLRAIKARGGLTLAQEPASASFDSMPRSVIDAGLADIVAAVEELPLRLADALARAPRRAFGLGGGSPGAETVARSSAFDEICVVLRERSSHDFSLYKKSTLYRRIERRMAIHRIERIGDYVRYLSETPQEVDLLFKELLIGVTRFFRDPACWSTLQQVALPGLLAGYPAGAALRAWVAGCSTGEEAYSLAIAFRELQQELPAPSARRSLQIFATDLDSDAIGQARRGVYPSTIAADVSPQRLARFFIADAKGSGYRVVREIREMVVFAAHNLIMDPPFTKLDILSCRNLLIYLGSDLQKRLLPLFHYSLNPDGILMLGSAESVGSLHELFSPFEGQSRLFRRSSNPLPPVDLEFPSRHFPIRIESPMDAKPEYATVNLQKLADQVLLQQFSPPAVLVNASGDLVYISGRTGKYLEPAAGKVNWNIHALARQGLRHELALALPEALRSGERVIARNLRVETNSGIQRVDLTVQRLDEPAALRGMAMVLFSDVAAWPPPANATADDEPPPCGPRDAEVAWALTLAQQEKQALREEMQSAHEELTSSNEELQSINEELTTSKEEMQSLNEQLHTVNLDLQSKVDELSSATRDMATLLDSSDMLTVILDRALRLRRYSAQATRLFKLIPGDLGRPLADIVCDLVYPGLLDDADKVLRSLVVSDRDMATDDGRWYRVAIKPCRSPTRVVDGVLISCHDISRTKTLETALRALGGDPQAVR